MTSYELDARVIPHADRHSTILATFDALAVQESFVLVNDHDPVPLRGLFEREYPRGYDWEYLDEAPEWRIRITMLAATPLPRLLADTADLAGPTAEADLFGAVWRLDVAERDLDANVIAIAPEGRIATHAGPDLDVLLHVIAGSGRVVTERDVVPLGPGGLVWLPRRSQRSIEAGPDGLRYLSVHRRKPGLSIRSTR
ncbi:DUF2249 domain-containing protein [Pseudactinotalea sp. HY158]|uniref:DUF2249 domain-containing protein n=1 Tax=Pseudactinotalea sp. HY158 TaxID=2654547 RepID=UPI00129D0BB5|nr:DUF2249 domain-containing protein [Pseudactinotalea sp. HY158]QGH69593.1 DUF2249 domain-containing protein [Pseudactinotalea sp. HY158]